MDIPIPPPLPPSTIPPSQAPSQTQTQPQAPLTRFPPFPSPPSSSEPIIPFSKFKEHGIQIFADPSTGIELDGLGIPTVRLRVPHDTDVCKTTAKPKPRVVKGEGDGDGEDAEDADEDDPDEGPKKRKKRKKKKKFPSQLQDQNDGTDQPQLPNKNRRNTSLPIDLSTISDPVERAQEQKRQRLLLFAKQEWWEQWAAGEDLRKGRPVYDSSLSPTDRIHLAATDFRTGRIWPPGSTQLRYLWDQFRLYTGLLGSTPLWKRVDLVNDATKANANANGDVDDDNEDSDDEESFARQSSSTKSKPKPRPKPTNSDSDFDEEEEPEPEEEREPTPPPRPPQTPHKRIPPRAPYALFSYKPIIIPHIPSFSSSSLSNSNSSKPTPKDLTPLALSQIPLLLSLASSLRHTRLLTFLSSPVQIISEFLSSYVYSQGLVYAAPGRMVGVGRLVVFFLEFVLRVGALREEGGPRKGGDRGARAGKGKGNMEREFNKAVEVARRAAVEIPRAGWVVRVCPDVLGRGCEGLWGRVWREDGWWGVGAAGGADGNGAEDKEDGNEKEADGKGQGKDGVNKEGEDEVTRMKRFEDELRAANVQLVSADPLELGVPGINGDGDDVEEHGEGEVLARIDEDEDPIMIDTTKPKDNPIDIDIDIISPLSPGYIESYSSDSEGEVEGQSTPRPQPRSSTSVVQIDNGPVTVNEQTQARAINGDTDAPIPADSTATDQNQNQGPDRIQFTPRSKTEADEPPSTNTEAEKGTEGDDVTRSESPSGNYNTDWTRPPNAKDINDKPRTEREKLEDERSPWLPPCVQPLFGVLGSMSAFPLRFAPGGRSADVGCAEKSVRRVKEIVSASAARTGAGESVGAAKMQKWTGSGAEEALVDAFARVVLEPWVDWDDAGCVGLYTVPRVQGPRALTQEEEDLAASPSPSADEDDEQDEGTEITTPEPEVRKQKQRIAKRIVYERTKYAHDPVKDEITVLMEPRVAEALSVGMGLVGTWVQLVPVPPPPSSLHSSSGTRGRGRARGRGGRGQGRGRGRGGATNNGTGPPPKQRTFWYIEDLHMAVPSYWAVPPRGVPGSLLAEGEELARMFYEAVEAGEGGGAGGEYGGGGGEDGPYVDEMEMEMGLMEEDEFSD